MRRPCFCNKDTCKPCSLFHNDIRYQNLWRDSTIVEQAKTLITAVAKRIESDFKDVPKEVFEKRLSICASCPNKTSDWRCKLCGCFISIKAKWATETCPENKWELPVVSETNDGGCNCTKR